MSRKKIIFTSAFGCFCTAALVFSRSPKGEAILDTKHAASGALTGVIGIWCCSKRIWAHRRQLVRGLPFRSKVNAGKPSLIWDPKARSRTHCRVTTPLWDPGADSGQRTKTKSWGKIRTKNDCSARPWGRRAMIPANERFLLLDCSGHSASVLRDSAV